MYKIVATYHYPVDDEECYGDFWELQVNLYRGGKLIYSDNFGDEYHNDASAYFSGFIKGIEFAYNTVIELETNHVADVE